MTFNVLLRWHFINKNNKQRKEINAKMRTLITNSKEAKLWKIEARLAGAELCCSWKSLCVLFCFGREENSVLRRASDQIVRDIIVYHVSII